MARPNSIAVGGYEPTPTGLILSIAALIHVEQSYGRGDYTLLDPCAGDGAAIWGLRAALWPGEKHPHGIYACELEATRFVALEKRAQLDAWNSSKVLLGDAFAIDWIDKANIEYRHERKHDGVSICLANPPYHNGDLEARFTDRFTQAIAPGGVLVLVVPYYALHKCAATLATHFSEVYAYKFPDPEYDLFRQCVVYAVKRSAPLLEPSAALRAQIEAWARDVSLMPVLPAAGTVDPVVRVLPHDRCGFDEWRMRPADTSVLLDRFVPWHEMNRTGALHPIAGVLPDHAGGDLLRRQYPMAVAPAAAYIGTAIAGGTYNGARIEPDDPSSGLPPLLVKGVFDKDYKTIDEKTNKKGETTAIVRIEQPMLRVTVLDLRAHVYYTLGNDDEETGAATVDMMTVGDLVANYSRDLVRVMLENCPLTHDKNNPADEIPLPDYGRPLFTAQRHAVMALVKLLGGLNVTPRMRRGRGAYLLGEVGCGKSFILLAVAHALGIKRVLVACPPHLIDGWIEQVQLALPGARAVPLNDVADVDAFAAEDYDGMMVGIMPTTMAKLGHSYEGVTVRCCPECGSPVPQVAKRGGDNAEELARLRALCKATRRVPNGPMAFAAHRLALSMLTAVPHAAEVAQCLSGFNEHRLLESARKRQPVPNSMAVQTDDGQTKLAQARAWEEIRTGHVLRDAISVVAGACVGMRQGYTRHEFDTKRGREETLVGLLAARNDTTTTLEVAEWVYKAGKPKDRYDNEASARRTLASELLCLLPVADARAAVERWRALSIDDSSIWNGLEGRLAAIEKYSSAAKPDPDLSYYSTPKKEAPYVGHGLAADNGAVRTWHKHELGSLACGVDALGALASEGAWRTTLPCGAALYQAVPAPRRVALANWIAKRHRNLFGLFVVDESHEAKRGESARSQAVRRLIRLGLPTIAATGSVMGGYAEDLFSMQWSLDPMFREEFPNGYSVREHVNRDGTTTCRKYSDAGEFGRRYGFLKQLVDVSDRKSSTKEMGFGRQSDRIDDSSVRTIGYAPGVLPLFILRYLLRIAVVIHKSDLDVELPPLREIVEQVAVTAAQGAAYGRLQKELTTQIKKDRFNPDKAGRLMGAMAEIPAYFDLCTSDVGNIEDGAHQGEYRICYPNNRDLGVDAGRCIASEPGLTPNDLLPKEEWMVETVKRELAEGRPCMVFATHRRLLPRLRRILHEATGEYVAYLDASKVEADERIAWINHNILGKEETVEKRGKVTVVPGTHARILVVNGQAVQTGINNLVHFCTVVWMENPRVDAIAYRQAVGRTHRIGQTREVRVYFPIYRATVQATAHELLLHKVAVSLGTDGLDATSALAAAGVGDGSGLEGYSVGRLLFEIQSGERVIKRRARVTA